ncbi:hypothetical protein CSW37_06665 [Thermus scotoductus]|uniref:Uncharacterized protein n=1 Tax=Thermus scotoductus TaxID=37636 RepID=A0A430SF41_THESC|nr:hypothetical protein CSW37_06665 [Thermus scotoductus]
MWEGRDDHDVPVQVEITFPFFRATWANPGPEKASQEVRQGESPQGGSREAEEEGQVPKPAENRWSRA